MVGNYTKFLRMSIILSFLIDAELAPYLSIVYQYCQGAETRQENKENVAENPLKLSR